jgi:hypothetical protein
MNLFPIFSYIIPDWNLDSGRKMQKPTAPRGFRKGNWAKSCIVHSGNDDDYVSKNGMK